MKGPVSFVPGVEDDTEEIEVFTIADWEKMNSPSCTCGGWKTYGEKNDRYFHSHWCDVVLRETPPKIEW